MSFNSCTLIENKIETAKQNNHRAIFVTSNEKMVRAIITSYEDPSIIHIKSRIEKRAKEKEKSKNRHKSAKCNTGTGNTIEYKRIDTILGCTYDVVVFDDFMTITPNVFAKAFEAIGGGGSAVLVVDGMPKFGYWGRFFRNLKRSACGVFLDNENTFRINKNEISEKNAKSPDMVDRKNLEDIEYESSTEPDQCAFNKIFDLTKTDDQRHVLKSITRDMSDANFISIITSNRGRGKSATLGLLVAIAINRNFKKIQILAPFAENVQIIFKFVKFGLECLGFQENCDFESDELKPNFQTASKTKLTKKITFRKKQVVEYVSPGSSKCLFSSNNDFNDLLVIDEAAAIPPALLYDKIRNNGCVFIATTTSGYEGTGQFFSTKLLHFLQYLSSGKYKGNVPNIRFYSLYEPIRYSFSDPAEKFLFDTLFLKNDAPPNQDTLIPIENYDLHHVNMDILVKYKHKSDGHLKPDTPNSGLDSIPVPEQILQAITQLLASSHYRNSPDDMFQLIENPNHHLFLLLSENEENILQRMVCAVHVIIEKENTKIGNLLKNTISDHYDIDKLSDFVGLRIFRIAVHPDFQHKGFGSLAIKKLIKFVDNSNISSLTTIPGQKNIHQNENNDVLFDNKGPVLPFIEYIGVSFGFDHNLYDFWSKNGFWPLYLHHRQNEVSGAYSIIMIHCKGADFHSNEDNWVKNINLIFKRRLIGLLGFYFKEFKTEYVWRLIKSPDCTKNKELLIYESKDKLTPKNKVLNFNEDEIYRIKRFLKGQYSIYEIFDIIPSMATFYFQLDRNFLTKEEELFLIKTGLMHCDVNELSNEINKPKELIHSWGYSAIREIFNFTK